MDWRYGDERIWRSHRLVALALQQADGNHAISMDHYEMLASAALEALLRELYLPRMIVKETHE